MPPLSLAYTADSYRCYIRLLFLSKKSYCVQSKKTDDFCCERQFWKSSMFDAFSPLTFKDKTGLCAAMKEKSLRQG